MNIFNIVTLESLKKNRTRTIVTIIGVILSAAMITAVTTFIASLQNWLVQSEIDRRGDWHVEFIDVDNAFVQERLNDDELRNLAVIQSIGFAELKGAERVLPHDGAPLPYLFVRGFTEEALDMIPIPIITGRLPENDNEIIISQHIEHTARVKFNVGDKITLPIGERTIDGKRLGRQNSIVFNEDYEALEVFTPNFTQAFTIVGVYRPAFENHSSQFFTVITKTSLETATAQENYFYVLAALKSPQNVYDYTEAVAGTFSFSFNSGLLRFLGVSNHENFNTILYSLGAILISLVMVGSILLIYNSFAISVSERSRQFGILSSVGATSKQIRKSVLFEGICVGAIGIPVGIIAGIVGIGITIRFIDGIAGEAFFGSTSITLSVSLPAVAVAALVSALTIFLSAYIPAKRASKRSAIDIIRQTTDIKIKNKVMKTSPITQKLFGLEGTLALKNFKRSKKRYRSTVISLFVSIVLFISASAFALYLQKGVNISVADYGYDIMFSSDLMERDDIVDLFYKLREVDDVYDGSYYSGVTFYGGEIPTSLLSRRFIEFNHIDDVHDTVSIGGIISFIDDESYQRYLSELGLSELTAERNIFPAVAKTQEYNRETQRFISFDMFQDTSELPLQISSNHDYDNDERLYKEASIKLVDTMPAVVSQNHYAGLIVFAPFSSIGEFPFDPDEHFSQVLTFLSTNPLRSDAEMRLIIDAKMNSLSAAGALSTGYSFFNVAQSQQENRSIILIMNIFTYGFVILISLITIANVFNTISTGINLRKREFAMLRSVGMTDGGFNKMMNYECLFYGLKALLFGLPTALLVTFFIYQAVTEGVDVRFTLPWNSIAISIFSVFAIVFITMMYSMDKIKKANILDALKDEQA